MGGSVIFYTYGSTLELNGQQLTAGMLTADLLNRTNISPWTNA